jgi:hypothetical protein
MIYNTALESLYPGLSELNDVDTDVTYGLMRGKSLFSFQSNPVVHPAWRLLATKPGLHDPQSCLPKRFYGLTNGPFTFAPVGIFVHCSANSGSNLGNTLSKVLGR